MATIALYSFKHSPNPLKVRFALAELGLDYELREVNLFRGEHRAPDFLAINPHGKVPVLEEEGFILRESNAILWHLGQRHGDALFPDDLASQSEAMQWLFFESVHLASDAGTLWWTEVVSPAIGSTPSPESAVLEATHGLERSLNVLESHLSHSLYVMGSQFTLVDCAIGTTVNMLRGTRLDNSEKWPAVIEYRERMRKRPSWEKANGNLIHHFKPKGA